MESVFYKKGIQKHMFLKHQHNILVIQDFNYKVFINIPAKFFLVLIIDECQKVCTYICTDT